VSIFVCLSAVRPPKAKPFLNKGSHSHAFPHKRHSPHFGLRCNLGVRINDRLHLAPLVGHSSMGPPEHHWNFLILMKSNLLSQHLLRPISAALSTLPPLLHCITQTHCALVAHQNHFGRLLSDRAQVRKAAQLRSSCLSGIKDLLMSGKPSCALACPFPKFHAANWALHTMSSDGQRCRRRSRT